MIHYQPYYGSNTIKKQSTKLVNMANQLLSQIRTLQTHEYIQVPMTKYMHVKMVDPMVIFMTITGLYPTLME